MLQPSETSYFSQPAASLDPRLFRNEKLDPQVRSAILQLLFNHLNALYSGAEGWASPMLAGSGVSYQWAANRDPGDLDCLVVISFPRFREANSAYRGLGDDDIASLLNEQFRELLHPLTALFLGSFELTFYAITAPVITDIKPYAAYSLISDDWVVAPSLEMPISTPEWERAVDKDRSNALDILTKFIAAKSKYEGSTNEAIKANARSEMRVASSQGLAMYEDIHGGRSAAFSKTGQGYSDFANYRWQSGKSTGVVQALRNIKAEMEAQDAASRSSYGVDFPDTNTLIRRAATYRS